MINASKEFRELIKKGTKIVNYADFTLKDGTVLNLGPSDFTVSGFSLSDKTSNGKFEIGTAIAKNIEITLANHTNKFSEYDFDKAIIYMYVAVEKEDGTVLKERKGKYYVLLANTPGDTIVISAVDSMYRFDKKYKSNLSFPATLQDILVECCVYCGVNMGFKEFENSNFVVENKPEDCTYRQVVSWVAQIAGFNARISVDDRLELVWYDFSGRNGGIDGGNFYIYDETAIYDGGNFLYYDEENILDGGNFTDYVPERITMIKKLTVGTDDVVITGTAVEYDDVLIESGSNEYILKIEDNPLTAGKEKEICEILYNKFVGISFRPMEAEIPNNPLFESIDTCYVFDRKGNAYFSIINDLSYSINGFTRISCKADNPVRNESSYVSESAKAIVQARRNTEKQLTLYDQAVQNMNLLASNAMGLYRESEKQLDGSVIYYMSNRPILKDENGICIFEENSVVYKMTGDGFFVSTDGGITYTSGFDSEGNAVVNVLSAIGITFDWARGGTITLGGDNNVNGVLTVLDKNGLEVGRWDNSGIKLPPGTKIAWTQIDDAEEQVTVITKDTVTTEFINALKIKAGSVDAENITGETIEGKKIKGGSISIGSYFSVDSNGNVVAKSADITGGEIGGFTIGLSSIYNNTISISSSAKGVYLGTDGINLGGKAVITSDGKATFSDIEITGNGSIDFSYGSDKMQLSYSGIKFGSSAFNVSINKNEVRAYNTYLDSEGLHVRSSSTYFTDISQNKIIISGGSSSNYSGIYAGNTSSPIIEMYKDFVNIPTKTVWIRNQETTSGAVLIGGYYDKIGFFNSTGTTKTTVTKLSTSYQNSITEVFKKLNELISALDGYGLI